MEVFLGKKLRFSDRGKAPFNFERDFYIPLNFRVLNALKSHKMSQKGKKSSSFISHPFGTTIRLHEAIKHPENSLKMAVAQNTCFQLTDYFVLICSLIKYLIIKYAKEKESFLFNFSFLFLFFLVIIDENLNKFFFLGVY